MFKRNLLIFCIVVLLISSYSTSVLALSISITGQNEARYARGSQVGFEDAGSYSYFENYLEFNLNVEKFRFYLRQGYQLPSEFSDFQAGINAYDKRYIQYTDDHFSIRGGDFYDIWGQGLLFGNVELRELNIDSGLEGLFVESSFLNFEAAAFRGTEQDENNESVESAEGVYLSHDLPFDVLLGGSIVRLDENERHPIILRSGLELSYELGPFSLYSAYMSDELDLDPVKYHSGFYMNSTVYGSGWGLLGEYKNYRLYTHDGDLSLQYPPTAIPEATMHLLDSHPRTVLFNDDVGYQFELTLSHEDWNAILNFNQSSEHDDQSLIPSLQEEMSPYRSLFVQIERYPYDGDRFVLQSGWNEDVTFTKTATGGYSVWYQRFGIGGIYERSFSEKFDISTDMQVMMVNNHGIDHKYWEEYFSVSCIIQPNVTLTGSIERSEDVDEDGGLKWKTGTIGGEGRYWPSMETSIEMSQSHKVRVFLGHERGGLRCTGGSCRWVNPFKGVKIDMISQF